MELTAVPATCFSSEQLTTILSDCFEPFEVGIASRLTDEFWRRKSTD